MLDARRYGAIILKNALYAGQLVDDLKLTYQLQSNMLPIRAGAGNITRFVREVVIDMLNAPEYEGRQISFTAAREDVPYSFDARLLRRALANILANALKHNKPGTEIAVSLGGGSDVEIVIADQGKGMTPEELDGLFKRYYRGGNTDGKAEGSGLGMAIAKQIVEAHNGSLSAQSVVGAGTTVTMWLPSQGKV